MVIIDTHSLYEKYKPQRLDYVKLVELLSVEFGHILDVSTLNIAYIAKSRTSKCFARFLEQLGFTVFEKELLPGDHFDVDIVLELMNTIDQSNLICSTTRMLSQLPITIVSDFPQTIMREPNGTVPAT